MEFEVVVVGLLHLNGKVVSQQSQLIDDVPLEPNGALEELEIHKATINQLRE